jgi:ligand-binding sensor domain-containing protein/signal transduction histidine kinase
MRCDHGSRLSCSLSPAALQGQCQALASRGDAAKDPFPGSIRLVDANDIRFRRLGQNAGLSQTRAEWVAQDRVGFLWFGTQYGLNRFDGYRSKTFKHEPGKPDSLSCVYIRSLLVDRAGALWVGCDRYLDRFQPETETFVHYQIDREVSEQLSTPIIRIDEDRAGFLWLSTAKGLYRFNPKDGQTQRFVHNPLDPNSLGNNRISMTAEDHEGRFWVADGSGLEQLDRATGKVVGRAPVGGEISRFYEDENGLYWMASTCGLIIWNPKAGGARCHSLNYTLGSKPANATISGIVKARDGTLWFSSTAGLLRLDRAHNEIVRYHNNPLDNESLESDRLISLFQDNQDDIWTCFQGVEPNFFIDRPQPFQSFTYQRGNLLDPLVTSIYDDPKGILWIGSMGGLNRIDRRTGANTPSPKVENEILAIVEDPRGVLIGGTFHEGLKRIDPTTGSASSYFQGGTVPFADPIMRLAYSHDGTLWAAMYGGVGRYNQSTGAFETHTPETRNTIQYQEIKEGKDGVLWLGAQSGLHRFDPRTGQFKIYEHHADDPKSLSDNRVNSVHFDGRGTLWVGTQNGLGKLDAAAGTFRNYFEQDGLAGAVVSCLLEDKHGILWMSTNNGVSSFDPNTDRFQSFSVADGLSGQDLTGWGACYQSPTGEMFFGGFGGATAFYPDKLANTTSAPAIVLTDFRLSGNGVGIGEGSPLKESITLARTITLSPRQNIFSIEFSALGFLNSETNRYRYKLDGLDDTWHEVGSDRRVANYTTLPAGMYTFEVQGATSRGPWSEPGARLQIEILPAWYQTFWFRSLCVIALVLVAWGIYWLRLAELHRQFNVALDARVDERTRIARELHDTLLQSFNGLLLRFQAVSGLLPARPDEAKTRIDQAIDHAANAIAEGRDAVHELRSGGLSTTDLGTALNNFAKELMSGFASDAQPSLRIQVEGAPKPLDPMVRDEVYRAGAEALRNAIRHADARHIEVEIRYDESALRLRVRDDGRVSIQRCSSRITESDIGACAACANGPNWWEEPARSGASSIRGPRLK